VSEANGATRDPAGAPDERSELINSSACARIEKKFFIFFLLFVRTLEISLFVITIMNCVNFIFIPLRVFYFFIF